MNQLQSPPVRRKLGEILSDAGVVDALQLQSALGHQRQWGGRLGHILIDLHFIDEDTLARTLAQQLGLELVDLGASALSVDLARLVPQSVAERHGVFPVRFEAQAGAGTLTVAFSDPTNLAAIDEVRFQTGKAIQIAVCSEGQITQAIRRFYYGEDPTAQQAQVAEPATLFGDVEGFLSSDDEELAELEPLPNDSVIMSAADHRALGLEHDSDLGTSDPLAGFLSELAASPGSFGPHEMAQSPVVAPARGFEHRVAVPLTSGSVAAQAPGALPAPARRPFAASEAHGSSRRPLPPTEPIPRLERALTPHVPEAALLAQRSEDILSQAVDLHGKTVEGTLLAADFSDPVSSLDTTRPGVVLESFLFPDDHAAEPTRPSIPLLDLQLPLDEWGAQPVSQPVSEPLSPDAFAAEHGVPAPLAEADAHGAASHFAAPHLVPQPAPDETSFAEPLPTLQPVAPAHGTTPGGAASPFGADFGDADLGAALSGLEKPRTGSWSVQPLVPRAPSGEQYVRALSRLLVKKGLIEEAELLAELAANE